MTVQEIINSISRDEILGAIEDFNCNELPIRGRKITEFVSKDDKLYPVKELLLQAKPEIKSASNYSSSSYNTNMAKACLSALGFDIISTQKEQAKLSITSYYIKRVLNQDVERTFSISNESATDFFMLELDNGEEQFVSIYYKNENQIEETVIQKRNTRNEYRFFPKHKENIQEGDILLFQNIEDGYTMEVFKQGNLFEALDILLNGNNHLLTDSLLLKQDNKSIETKMNNYPLNQILYGPPGTGKTYITILKSLSILGIDYTDYADALEKFQQELGNRIEFVSMHQSFSYEDFVQGLRPKSINGTIQFDYVDGVFKKICTRATEAITGDRSEVSSSQISNYEIALIAFFLSKFNGKRKDQKQGVKLLGYESDDEAFRLIGEKIGLKPNSLKNHRDKFDFIFKDRPGYTSRKGWTPRNGEEELDNTSSWPYHDIYIELKNIEINELADRIISILKKFETPAITNPDGGNFVIVLDEINRANISKVFGELITLIEEDKRDAFTVRLPSGELFAVPNNLFIIGTMNTADKSVSMVDIALRRRFEFEAMYPRPDLVEDKVKRDFMDSLNLAILEKKGIDFQIGHSDFMKSLDLTIIINRKIIPLLMEYFRNRHEEVTEILKICLPGSMKIDEELLKWKQVKVINKG